MIDKEHSLKYDDMSDIGIIRKCRPINEGGSTLVDGYTASIIV